MGFSVLIPAMSDLVPYYHVADFKISLGMAAYALCAFLAAPVLGQLSDKYGRKWILVACVVGTAISYFFLFIHNFWMYILARVINGIT